jgi:hypothetical protein
MKRPTFSRSALQKDRRDLDPHKLETLGNQIAA